MTAVGGSQLVLIVSLFPQVMEMVRDCLSKSQERCITSRYFYDLSENLEKLLNEVSLTEML